MERMTKYYPEALALVMEELISATKVHGPFHSAHEGISVIEEEFIELRDEVFLKESKRIPEDMIEEAKQLAAMGLRFLIDVALPFRDKRNAMA